MPQTDASAARTSGRDRLLNAATKLVAESGLSALTIESVAAAAGVTKGGLIYHFKTRDDLLQSVVARTVEELESRSRARAGRLGKAVTPRSLLLALAEVTFDMPADERRLFANLLGAASSYPHLMGPARSMVQRSHAEFGAGGSKAGHALLLAAALDGITLLDLLNLHQFSPGQRRAMHRALKSLAKDLP